MLVLLEYQVEPAVAPIIVYFVFHALGYYISIVYSPSHWKAHSMNRERVIIF